MLVLNIVGEENDDQQFNAAWRWCRYRRPPCVTVLTALPTFAQGAPVRIGLHVRRCEGGCRLWGRTNWEVRQIVGHHQENLAL